jgi:hypothetical protein
VTKETLMTQLKHTSMLPESTSAGLKENSNSTMPCQLKMIDTLLRPGERKQSLQAAAKLAQEVTCRKPGTNYSASHAGTPMKAFSSTWNVMDEGRTAYGLPSASTANLLAIRKAGVLYSM